MQEERENNPHGKMKEEKTVEVSEAQPMLGQVIGDDLQRRGMIRLIVTKIRHALAYGVKWQVF